MFGYGTKRTSAHDYVMSANDPLRTFPMVLGAQINGVVAAERVVVDGKVEGPIQGGEVILRSQAHVVGDIHHQFLAIERGAYFDGRSIQVRGANGHQPERVGHKRLTQVTNDSQEARTSLGRVDSLGSAENVAT